MSPSHAAKAGRRWRYYVSPSCRAANTRRDPSPGCRRWRSKPGSPTRRARPRPLPIGRVGMDCQPKASGHGASTDSPAVRPSDYDATLRAAIERVVMSRTTIEIELAEGMVSDDQNRILIIPWTPPSHHRCRENHPRRGRTTRRYGPDENRSARARHRRASRRSSLARRTDHESQPKHRIARSARSS
jgi:hypothetical protein